MITFLKKAPHSVGIFERFVFSGNLSRLGIDLMKFAENETKITTML